MNCRWINTQLAFLLLFVLLSIPSLSATYTSNNSGDWYTNGNWDIAGYPGAGDIVIIQAAHSITLSSTTTTSEVQLAGVLVVNSGITLNCSSSFTQSNGTLTDNGSVIITGNYIQTTGDCNIANTATLSASNITVVNMTLNNGGTLNCNDFSSSGSIAWSGTVNLSGNCTFTNGTINISQAVSFPGYLYTQNTAALTTSGGLTITGVFQIQNSSSAVIGANSSCASITSNGSLTVSNGFQLTDNSTFSQTGGTVTVTGTLACTGNYTQNAGTLNINGTLSCANISTGATANINNTLTLSAGGDYTITGGTTTLGNDLSIPGDLILTNGTFDIDANQLTINGNITYTSGKIDASNSASTLFIESTGTSTLNTSWFLSTTIGNLTINRAVSVSGSFNVGGQLNLLGGDLTISGANTLTLNQDIAGANQIIANSSSSLVLLGNTSWVAGTVLTGISNLNSLTLDLLHANNTISTSTNLTIAGTLTLTNGFLDITGDQLTLNADVSAGGKIIADNTSSLVLQGSSSWSSTRILTNITALNNLTITLSHATNKVIATSDNFEIAGILTISSGSLNITGYALTLNNDLTNAGNLTATSTSSLILQGNAVWSTNKVLSGISNLNNLTINLTNAGNNTLATNTNLAIAGTLTMSNGYLDITGDQLTLNNDVSAGGQIITSATSSLVLQGSSAWVAGRILTSISNLNNLTINLTNAGSKTINQVAATLTIAGTISIASGTLNIGSNTLNLVTNLTLSGTGNFTSSSSGIINFNGASAITNSGSGDITFGELQVANTKTVTCTADLEIQNDITITGTGSFTASSRTISLNGSSSVGIDNSGTLQFNDLEIKTSSAGCTPTTSFSIIGDLYVNNTFNPSAGTVTFSGSSQQELYGTNEPTFYNLTLNNSNGLKLNQNIKFIASAQSTLTLTSGDIDLNGTYLITFQNANDRLSESAGNNIVNTGSPATGYLITTANISTTNLATADLGLTLTGPTNLTIRMYPKTACNDGIPSVKRYFMITYTGSITDMSIEYDNTELYGTASNLSLYSSSDLSDWEKHPSTASAGASTGSVSATNDLSLDNPIYFALFTSAKFFSNDGGNGLWSAAENWKDSLKPEESDVVVIGSYAVYLDEDVTITDLVLSKSNTYLKPKNTGIYSMTLLGSLTCGGTDCAEPSSDKFNGVNGEGRINVIFNNSSQKAITTYQDGELVFYNVKITDESDLITSGNYRIDITGDLVIEGTGSFVPATGTNINFLGARHLSSGISKNSKKPKLQSDYLSSPGVQTIDNATTATLTFGIVTIADGSQVTTNSDFTVTSLFEVLGSGSFIATAGTITFNGNPATVQKSNSGTMKFNKIINTGSLNTDASFHIIDNFVTSGAFTQTDGEVVFQNKGSFAYPKQIVNSNSSAIRFANLIIEDGSYVTTTSDFTIADNAANVLEVRGNGYFKTTGTTTIGTAGATATTIITNSNQGVLELNDLTIANVAVTCSTASNFIIHGDFIVNTDATFLATTPSEITFNNNSTAGTQQSIGGASMNQTFSTIIIDDATTVNTSTVFTVTGDFKVLGNGSFTASAPSYVEFDGGNSKSILNNGYLEFYDLILSSAASGNNLVTTESDFTVANELTTQANSNNGCLKADGNSTITLGSAGAVTNPLTGVGGLGSSLEFMNLIIPSGATQNISSSFRIKGDLINEGTLTCTAGTVYFAGNSAQKLTGSSSPTFFNVTLDNAYGLLLENSFSFANGGAGTLTITKGDLDLGGNNTITMNHASGVLSEATGYSIFNSIASEGGNTGGYITTAQIANAGLVDNSGLGLDITGSTATNITLKRYHSSLNINNVSSINRYYKVDFTNNITSATFTIDNSELNGYNAESLGFFSSTSDASSSWTANSTTYTMGSNNGHTGYHYLNNDGLSGLPTSVYLTALPRTVSLRALPNTGIHADNKLAESPLIAGQTNKVIFGFSIYSTADIDYLETLSIDFGNDISNSLSSIVLKYDNDGSLLTDDKTSSNASNSINENVITFSNINISLSAGVRKYFYIIATVNNSVETSTPAIQASITNENFTLTDTEISDFLIKGNRLTFSKLNLGLSSKNSPQSDALIKAGNGKDQVIYGFTITPPENSPTITFSSVNLKLEKGTGIPSTEFFNFKIFKDENKNGRKDDGDTQLGTTLVSYPSDNKISFASLAQTFSSEVEYLVTCQVSETATLNGSIKVSIDSKNELSVAYPANFITSGSFVGKKMIVKASGTPYELEIINISATTPVEGMGSKEIVSGENVSITIIAKDSRGVPQPVTENTQIQLSISRGNSSITTNGTQTLTMNNSEVTWNNLIITNSNSESNLEITANVISGMTTIKKGVLSDIKIYPQEPASSPSGLTLTNVTNNSVDISWTAGSPSKHLVVVRQNEEPIPPSNAEDYEAISGSNISNTANENNLTSKGSIVVYKGPNTSLTVRGLTSGKRYYIAVYTYNGSGSSIRYRTEANTTDYITIADTTILYSEPTVTASNLSITNVESNSLTLNWAPGNGQRRIVYCRRGSDVTDVPTDATHYPSNSIFGIDSTKTGNSYIVYNGVGANRVTVSNLVPNTTYYFAIYEYNGTYNNSNYLLTAGQTSRKTLESEPSAQAKNVSFTLTSDPATEVYSSDNQIKLNWTNGDGDGRIVLAKVDAPISVDDYPQDGIGYYSSVSGSVPYTTNRLNNAYVVYNGTGSTNSATVTSISPGRQYYFRVFEYNGTGTTISTSSNVNYNIDDDYDNPNSSLADRFEDNNSKDDLEIWKYISSDNGNFTGYLNYKDDEDWLYLYLDFANNKNNARIKLSNLPNDYNIELYNSTGRLLRKSNAVGLEEETLTLNNLPEGIYFIRIYSPDGSYSLSPYVIKGESNSIRFFSTTQ